MEFKRGRNNTKDNYELISCRPDKKAKSQFFLLVRHDYRATELRVLSRILEIPIIPIFLMIILMIPTFPMIPIFPIIPIFIRIIGNILASHQKYWNL